MHFVEKCSKCKIVITQCRCPSKDKLVRWSVCSKCINEATTEALINVLDTVLKTDKESVDG